MKPATILCAALLTMSVAWFAGEKHRENCIREDRTGCSVLPWVAGTTPQTPQPNCRIAFCVKLGPSGP